MPHKKATISNPYYYLKNSYNNSISWALFYAESIIKRRLVSVE